MLAVAVAQPATSARDVAGNAVRHAEAVEAAGAAGARVVVFPELSVTGYELGAPPVDPDDPRLDVLAEACARTGTVALVGAPVRSAPRGAAGVHIAILRIEDGIREVVYRKQFLGGNEPRHCIPGPGPALVDVDGWRVGLGICKDTGQPRHIAAMVRLDLDLYVAGLVHRPEELAEQDARGFVLARACGSPVAFASFSGRTGDVFSETAGTSTVWSADGTVLARAGDRPGEVVSARVSRPRR
ncbi:hypothetical protein BJF85_15745 [Saccharomonospora sp. CUA-673]|nr:hypothetical protein BJF85_15745 [Saccharomonospora sp. CUA-673]